MNKHPVILNIKNVFIRENCPQQVWQELTQRPGKGKKETLKL